MTPPDQDVLAKYLDTQFEILNDRIEALRRGVVTLVERQQRLEECMNSIERLLLARSRDQGRP